MKQVGQSTICGVFVPVRSAGALADGATLLPEEANEVLATELEPLGKRMEERRKSSSSQSRLELGTEVRGYLRPGACGIVTKDPISAAVTSSATGAWWPARANGWVGRISRVRS